MSVAEEPPVQRRVVFVVGSGRSGTSTMAGTLQTLGMHVPQPEVATDDTNPKGFGEPQWVVDFHERAAQPVRRADRRRPPVRVVRHRPARHVRPAADAAARVARSPVRRGARAGGQGPAAGVVPRHVARGGDPLPRHAVVRHHAPPGHRGGRQQAEVLRGKQSEMQPHRGWVNVMLHTERATRGSQRAFVRYADLLDDWTVPVTGAAASSASPRSRAPPPTTCARCTPSSTRAAPRAAHLGRRGGAGPAARDRPGDLGRPRPAGRQGRRHPRAARDPRRAARGLHRLYSEAEALAQSTAPRARRGRRRRSPRRTAGRRAAGGSPTPSARWSRRARAAG